jgi:tRNA pseudouridine55 synthase
MNAQSSPGSEGVLIVDKPAGMTSHDVVDAIRKRFRTKKVGHGGTLDPDAAGVLVLGLGRATRLLSFSQSAPKRYRAGAKFGVSTSTQDASGETVEEKEPTFDRSQLEVELKSLSGDIEQIPPMVSAVKVGGKRLYKMARAGEEVERPARPVTVYAFDLVDFDADRYEAVFDVECSGGTYVRTLVHDLGARLGCGAHMTSLRRTAAGSFDEREAIALDDVDPSMLRPLSDAVRDLTRIDLTPDQASGVVHGRSLSVSESWPSLSEGEFVALFGEDQLLAVYKRAGNDLVPDRVLAS